MYDALVIGGGPAGLSAALVLGRARRSVLLCDDGRPRNAAARHMHGFLSRDGMAPAELLKVAREELRRYPSIELVETHVHAALRESGSFVMEAQNGNAYRGRTVLLATGLYDELPSIPGLRQRWGATAFVCPYCHGWEVADKRIAVIGEDGRAVQLAQELYQWSRDLLICTQGVQELNADDRRWAESVQAKVHRGPIASIGGERTEAEVNFRDGSRARCDAIFITAPLRQRYPLVDMLGVRVRNDGEIDVDARGRTNVSGCYAAGDAVTAVHQVTLAAASGVCAAMAINEDLIREEVRAAIART